MAISGSGEGGTDAPQVSRLTCHYLVVRLEWTRNQDETIYLDVESVTDTRESAVNYAEMHGGFLIAADWWPAHLRISSSFVR